MLLDQALEWMSGTRKVIEGRYLINGTQPQASLSHGASVARRGMGK